VSLTNGVLWATYYWKASKLKWPVALFTKILTIKNCRKCKTKIKKSFTKILMIILSVKIVLTLRVKIPCRKCKILNVREIFVLSVIVSEKIINKTLPLHSCFCSKIKEQFTVSAFSVTVRRIWIHCLTAS
jgi:hypothetical protein